MKKSGERVEKATRESKRGYKSVILSTGGIFTILFLIFLFFGFLVGNLIERNRVAELETEIEAIQNAVHDRLEIYTSALYGGKGLFDASVFVDRDEWKAYIESLQISENYPGIQGIGYSEWIPRDELANHEKRIQAEGFPNYFVKPQGDREVYTAIVYLEPFDIRNQQAFGFDMFQESIRRDAMERARDTASAALSGKVTLVQEIDDDVQAGFLIYVPVYDKDVLLNTVQERNNALLGYVYSPFRMDNFMRGILATHEGINIEIFDNELMVNGEENARMYGEPLAGDSFVTLSKALDYAGRTWEFRYTMLDTYGLDTVSRLVPYMVVFVGFLISLLISFVVFLFGSRREKAVQLAESMNADLVKGEVERKLAQKNLEKVNRELEEQTEILAEKMKELEKVNQYMVDRELKMVKMKNELKKSKKK